MKTSPTNKKIREIITMVKKEKLIPRPEFQRRLVWSREDKNHFLDSVLRGYPFPEIYLADGEVNLDTGEGTQLLVDGLQRVSTIVDYFDGATELKLLTIHPYKALTEEEKTAFLQYDVAVRDLGAVSKEQVVEVFRRLNATKYSLLDIEVNNAVYAGALKKFCERMAGCEFFRTHAIFSATDYKRMGDMRFVLAIIGTMMRGYFNRDDDFEDLLERHNDDLPEEVSLQARLQRVFDFIDECGFEQRSRVWKKADLFSLVIELDQALHHRGLGLEPGVVVDALQRFYDGVEGEVAGQSRPYAMYYKAALQASNDRISRIRRGRIVFGVISGQDMTSISSALAEEGLY
jgi:hypothetical protein